MLIWQPQGGSTLVNLATTVRHPEPMGTECIEACPSGDSVGSPAIPPGFSSCISFTLEKVQDTDAMSCIGFSPPADSQADRTDDQCCKGSEDKLRKSLRQRPSINYNEIDNSSEEESDSELFDHVAPSINILKKGVVRGCSNCANCLKVISRWQPSNSRRPILEEAPVFYPSEEEFKDTMKYIEGIREKAESYGICRIVPPPSWKPPCPLKEKNVWQNYEFITRIQRINRLQNRPSVRQFSRYRSISRKKRRRLFKRSVEHRDIDEYSMEASYPTYHSDNYCFETGPYFTLEAFNKYADDFKNQYFRSEVGSQAKSQRQFEPLVEDIEGEYWRVVEKPTEEIEVLYGADVETGGFRSGFPKASDKLVEEEYTKSGWNLNNFPRLPGSILSFESADISGVLVPWLYIGMCFSSFCWHVEDHHLYSLNYMHWGAAKMWYGVPGKDASKLEEVMKKHLPELFEEQPDLLHKLVTQFSPSILRSEGVQVYRCVQNAGEFVLTFPRGYHSGFNCGFNCAEAVNVAPFDWLPHGQNAVELYRDQCRKITISHDKLLLGAARQAVRAQWESLFLKKTTSDSLLWKNVCGSDKVLAKALKARLETECNRREQFCRASQCKKMDANFDTSGDKECFICHYDLHLSAAGCLCSPNKFACLNHAGQLCSCDGNKRFFLFRYEIGELNILVDALGGKLSAIHRWGISDLGLSLSSYVNKHKTQEQSFPSQYSIEGKDLVKPNEDVSRGASLQNQEIYVPKEKQDQCIGTSSCKWSVSSHEKGRGDHILDVKVDPLSCVVSVPDEKASLVSNHIVHNFNHENGLGSRVLKSSSCELNLEGKFTSKTALKLPVITNILVTPSFNECGDSKISGVLGNSLPVVSDSKTDMAKFPEVFSRIKTSDDNVTTCNKKDLVLDTPETSASIMKEGGACSLQNVEETGPRSSHSNIQEKPKGEAAPDNVLSLSVQQITSGFFQPNFQNMSVSTSTVKLVQDPGTSNQVDNVSSFINRCKTQNAAFSTIVVADGEASSDSIVRSIDRQSITDNSLFPSNSVEGVNLQRGPRMAKVVRRFNCAVEPLQFGVVLPGKLWSTSQAIYPKGYRSRVRYFSIRDPAQMCYYVSEILDGGPHGPLFMVQEEHWPGEVFIHLSATKCWDMVREKVNYEIRRWHGLGKFNMPSLQPPGSVDGLEMFGLSSPSVIQAIEALDRYHLCSEYWKSRNPDWNLASSISDKYPNLGSGAAVLKKLFEKADSEELQLLHLVLGDNQVLSRQELTNLLHEHIQRLPRSTNCT